MKETFNTFKLQMIAVISLVSHFNKCGFAIAKTLELYIDSYSIYWE